jgi:lipopolysaccharide transport system ATP-binding protein
MMVRLGFAIAAHLDPEILVVDEVLAVGDAEFQKKAIGKMQDVSEHEGRTVLFVSHNMGAVKNLCDNGILLENGSIKVSGKTAEVIETYLSQKTNKEQVYYPQNNVVTSVSATQGKNKIILSLKYKSKEIIKQPNFGFILYDNYDNPIFGTNPLKNGILEFGDHKNEGEVIVTIFSPFLADGVYPISIWFSDGLGMGEHLFEKEKCLSIHISDMDISFIDKHPNEGNVIPQCEWIFR